MRQENLTVIKGGLNRLRTKGAALNDSLYELLNGFVTTEKTVKVRPGTLLDETLPSGTKGLVAFDGVFHVFASSTVGGLPSNYTLHVLHSPNGQALSKIHFAQPFLGVLYVAAEFADAAVYHFWLRTADDWSASKIYDFNELAAPTVDNTFIYRATRSGDANILWVADAPRSVNDKVEPTVQNGFYFEVDQVFGAKAISGNVEPDWADATEGELFSETVDGTVVPRTPLPPSPPPDTLVPGTINTRYGDARSDEK